MKNVKTSKKIIKRKVISTILAALLFLGVVIIPIVYMTSCTKTKDSSSTKESVDTTSETYPTTHDDGTETVDTTVTESIDSTTEETTTEPVVTETETTVRTYSPENVDIDAGTYDANLNYAVVLNTKDNIDANLGKVISISGLFLYSYYPARNYYEYSILVMDENGEFSTTVSFELKNNAPFEDYPAAGAFMTVFGVVTKGEHGELFVADAEFVL